MFNKIVFIALYVLSTNTNIFRQSSSPKNANDTSLPLTQNYIDPFSLTSFYIVAQNGEHNLWTATGFFIKVKSIVYLITNNHVVGGKYKTAEYFRFYNRQLPRDSFPDSLKVRVYDKQIGFGHWLNIPIRNTSGEPYWIEFSEKETDATTLLDIVAIPITGLDYSNFAYSNTLDSSNLNSNLALYPAQDLYVVGYPLDLGQSVLYPIWKRGTIASDPNLLDLGISPFSIDATTRPGMSGSPVFFRNTQYTDKNGTANMLPFPYTYLVGIYSAQDLKSEVGIVIRLEKIFSKLSKENR